MGGDGEVGWHCCREDLGNGSATPKLTLLMLNTSCPVLANSVDPDQLASEEAN